MSKMLERLEQLEVRINDFRGSSEELVNPVASDVQSTIDGGGDNRSVKI
jgi:hypothetical protein